MARVIWTDPALSDLEAIADYIALDNRAAASRFVQKVFDRTGQLEAHPNSGRCPPELKRTHYRELVIPPCRLFYRVEQDVVYILYAMRSERLLREHLIRRSEETERD